MKSGNKTTYLAEAALIAALYVGLTFLSSVFGLAYGGVQFRISEALTLLPALFPAAVPGLTLGCIIANLTSPFGVVDIVVGASATLLAALVSRALRGMRVHGIPLLSALPPVIFNAVFVGAEITFFLPDGASLTGFLLSAGGVALGEAVVCLALGLPLTVTLERRLPQELFKK